MRLHLTAWSETRPPQRSLLAHAAILSGCVCVRLATQETTSTTSSKTSQCLWCRRVCRLDVFCAIFAIGCSRGEGVPKGPVHMLLNQRSASRAQDFKFPELIFLTLGPPTMFKHMKHV